MENNISAENIKNTQDSLGKFVKKPPLTDKLLRKPPFRFLHDIVTSVLRSSGFFDGLFGPEELVSDNVKDRDSKIAFLTKVIEVVSLVVEKPLSARPSKIISGQEPEKTNELLQYIASALDQKLSSDAAVKAVLNRKETKYNKDAKESVKTKSNTSKEAPARAVKEKPSNTNSDSKRRDSSVTKTDKSVISNSSDKKNRESSVSRGDKSLNGNSERKQRDNSVTKNEKALNNNSDRKTRDTLKISEKLQKELPKVKKQVEKTKVKQETKKKENINPKKVESPEAPEKTKQVISNIENNADTDVFGDEIVNSINIENTAVPKTEDIFVKKVPELQILNKSITNYELLRNNIETLTNGHDEPEKQNETEKTNTPLNDNILPVKGHNPSNISINDLAEVDTSIELLKENIQHEESNEPLAHVINKPSIDVMAKVNEEKSNKETRKPVKAFTKQKIEKPAVVQEKSSNSQDNNIVEKERPEVVPRPRTSLRPPSVRPPSARPGAPRLRDKKLDINANDGNIIQGKVNIIIENYGADNEEEDGSIVLMETNADTSLYGSNEEKNDSLDAQKSTATHGHLVQQILETQKEFIKTQGGSVEIEWEYGTRKAKEASAQEIETLRIGLQSVSKAANPLGKLLDNIQEDVEVMRQECEHWKTVHSQASSEFFKQKSEMDQAIIPLETKLKQLDVSIIEKWSKMNDLKGVIHKNHARIDKLLATNAVQ